MSILQLIGSREPDMLCCVLYDPRHKNAAVIVFIFFADINRLNRLKVFLEFLLT